MSDFLAYDPAGVMIPDHGITPEQLADLSFALDEARDEVLADSQLWLDGVEPPEKAPFDAGFHEMPDRLLAELRNRGEASTVARLRATAERVASEVDRVVSLGIGGSYMGARALLEACCHPYFNQLPRDQRQGRPRITFEGNNVDNDAMRGLIDLLEADRASGSDWAIVVISKSGGTLETAAAFRILVEKLRDHCGGDAKLLARRIIPVTGASGKLADLSDALGCPERYEVPDGVGGRFSVLSAVGLLPAAILGLDIVRLLEGARSDERTLSQYRPRRQHRSGLRRRLPSHGKTARLRHSAAINVGQAAGRPWSVVRPTPVRKPRQRGARRHAAHGGQYP